jgi:hypothetical protein
MWFVRSLLAASSINSDGLFLKVVEAEGVVSCLLLLCLVGPADAGRRGASAAEFVTELLLLLLAVERRLLLDDQLRSG